MKNFRLHPRPADLKLLEILMYLKVWEPLLCLWQQLSEIKTVLPDEIKLMAELSLWLRSCPFLNQYFRKAAFLLPKLKTWPSVFKKTKVKTEKNAFSSTNYFLNEDKSCINRSILLCISSREPIWLCVVCIIFIVEKYFILWIVTIYLSISFFLFFFLQTFITYIGLTSKWCRVYFFQIIGVPFYTPNSKIWEFWASHLHQHLVFLVCLISSI